MDFFFLRVPRFPPIMAMREAPYIMVARKQRQHAGMRRAGHRPQRQSLVMLFLQVDPPRLVLVSVLQTDSKYRLQRGFARVAYTVQAG